MTVILKTIIGTVAVLKDPQIFIGVVILILTNQMVAMITVGSQETFTLNYIGGMNWKNHSNV